MIDVNTLRLYGFTLVTIDLDSTLWSLHRVDVDRVPDVSEISQGIVYLRNFG
jgi:hypothetical protein